MAPAQSVTSPVMSPSFTHDTWACDGKESVPSPPIHSQGPCLFPTARSVTGRQTQPIKFLVNDHFIHLDSKIGICKRRSDLSPSPVGKGSSGNSLDTQIIRPRPRQTEPETGGGRARLVLVSLPGDSGSDSEPPCSADFSQKTGQSRCILMYLSQGKRKLEYRT